jgi:hypothetical protein
MKLTLVTDANACVVTRVARDRGLPLLQLFEQAAG